jgi:hypothetical protein
MPRYIQMRRHNHTSTVAHFDSGEEYLGREVVAFARECQATHKTQAAALETVPTISNTKFR